MLRTAQTDACQKSNHTKSLWWKNVFENKYSALAKSATYQYTLQSHLSTRSLALNKIQKSEIESSLVPQLSRQPIVGTSDFDKIIAKDALIVDKTLFIKEFMVDPSEVICILRPRQVDSAHS